MFFVLLYAKLVFDVYRMTLQTVFCDILAKDEQSYDAMGKEKREKSIMNTNTTQWEKLSRVYINLVVLIARNQNVGVAVLPTPTFEAILSAAKVTHWQVLGAACTPGMTRVLFRGDKQTAPTGV